MMPCRRYVVVPLVMAAVLTVACSVIIEGQNEEPNWPEAIDLMEQVDKKYADMGVAALHARGQFTEYGCPNLAEVAREVGADLYKWRQDFGKDLQYAKHVANTDQEMETFEYMMETTLIHIEYGDAIEEVLWDLRDEGTLLGCWPS